MTMSPSRAVALAFLAAAAAGALAHFAVHIAVGWSVLIALPVGAVVLVAGLLAGTFDADWTAEPEPSSPSPCGLASALTDRLTQAAHDQYRFTSRVRPRLRRLALDTLRRRPGTEDLVDLTDPRARDLLGADLHTLLTADDARLPPAPAFAALVRRLEEL